MCMRELLSIRDESFQTGDLVTKHNLLGMHHEWRQEEELEEGLVPLILVRSRAPWMRCWHLWWGALAVAMLFLAKSRILA